jgi:hypothetical protein
VLLPSPNVLALAEVVEPSACLLCAGAGRAVIGGIDRHCSCPTGRSMAVAHWVCKGNEEAAA